MFQFNFNLIYLFRLILPLYSHWSIFQSMCCDAMFVCQSSFWSQKGEANLKYILAKLGYIYFFNILFFLYIFYL